MNPVAHMITNTGAISAERGGTRRVPCYCSATREPVDSETPVWFKPVYQSSLRAGFGVDRSSRNKTQAGG
jgi:hypothetical protein